MVFSDILRSGLLEFRHLSDVQDVFGERLDLCGGGGFLLFYSVAGMDPCTAGCTPSLFSYGYNTKVYLLCLISVIQDK